MVYYAAKTGTDKVTPLMPATPFIFEYFLFNSIYQHDWEYTDSGGRLAMFETRLGNGGLREWEQQKKLLKYLEERCVEKPKQIERAFAPFKHLVDLNGVWAKITPDQKLSEKDGEDLFCAVREI